MGEYEVMLAGRDNGLGYLIAFKIHFRDTAKREESKFAKDKRG
jgi:hypothetical protein